MITKQLANFLAICLFQATNGQTGNAHENNEELVSTAAEVAVPWPCRDAVVVSVFAPGPGTGGHLLRVLRGDRGAAYPAGFLCRPSARLCTRGEHYLR